MKPDPKRIMVLAHAYATARVAHSHARSPRELAMARAEVCAALDVLQRAIYYAPPASADSAITRPATPAAGRRVR